MKRKTYNLQTIHSLMCAPQYVVSAVAGSISQSNLPTALEFDLVFLKIGLLSYKSVLVHMRLLRQRLLAEIHSFSMSNSQGPLLASNLPGSHRLDLQLETVSSPPLDFSR